MYKPATLRVVTIVLTSLFTYPCWAGHIPGHQDSGPVFPMPIPGREFFDGGGDEGGDGGAVFFVHFLGPVGGTIITNTQFDITYVSDGITPASDIVIGVSAPVDMQSREFHITGADLGFGSGSGTFTGTFETDELNGEVGQDFPDFPTVIHLTIDSVAGGVRGLGFFQDSFINLAVIPVPDPNGIRFDFNADGNVDVTDIDLLVAEIVAGTNEESFDLSGEGVVDETDLRQWLSDAAIHNGFSEAYLPGDTNLDGSVDATDLNNLGLKWQQDVANWSGGDITVDGRVNSADLNAIGINWQQSIPMASSASAPVPEPSAFLLTIVGLALVWRRPRYS